MRLVNICSKCDKPLERIGSVKLTDTLAINSYKCGHAFTEPIDHVDEAHGLVLKSVNRDKSARQYQEDGVKFIVESGFNCILADQMRLGKTPQALMALASRYKERTPALILVRSANLWQWINEYKVWTDSLPLGIYPIMGTKSFIPPGFSAYIMSMDTFSRGDMVDRLLTFGFRVVIVDEAHSFKNPESKRSKALIQFLHQISKEEITHVIPFACGVCKHEWEESVTVETNGSTGNRTVEKVAYCPSCHAWNKHSTHHEKIRKERKCGAVLLTGTPIKNRADEYFVPLNIVAPDVFPSLKAFRNQWLDSTGKRVLQYRLESFKRLIAPFILRREKEDVYTDIPKINRMFTVITIEDKLLKDLYNAALDRLEEKMNQSRSSKVGGFNFFDSIGELATLRKICGLAKVEWAVNYLDVCREEESGKKYAIGFHHHGVKDQLTAFLAPSGVMTLDGTDSPERKYEVMTKFRTAPELNVLIGMQAGKEGLEFVYLEDALVLERQWSSADEEQFEFRFYNPDKEFLKSRGLNPEKRTSIEYIVAKGTVDEFFYELVEEKRKIFGETIANNWDLTTDPATFKQLCERAVSHRL